MCVSRTAAVSGLRVSCHVVEEICAKEHRGMFSFVVGDGSSELSPLFTRTGFEFGGPAVIEEPGATTWSSWHDRRDLPDGQILIDTRWRS